MNGNIFHSSTLKLITFFISFIFVFFITVSLTSGLSDSESTENTSLAVDAIISDKRGRFPLIIIDPGHGGRDGGASSEGGALEKDINLQISNMISRLSTAYGIDCMLTRDKDEMLGSELSGNKKKMKDLKCRVNLANSSDNCIFVSIHQNKFPQKKYSGLQVYYSRNSVYSKPLAEKIQSTVKKNIQTDNDRVVKPASSSIYVLDNVKCPAVLVECGFLSNDAEAKLLSDTDYQKKLSACIFTAVFNYLQEYSNEK